MDRLEGIKEVRNSVGDKKYIHIDLDTIDWLISEIEQLRKEIEHYRTHYRGGKEGIRLPKEWLLTNWIIHRKEAFFCTNEYRMKILKEMQQALKGGE